MTMSPGNLCVAAEKRLHCLTQSSDPLTLHNKTPIENLSRGSGKSRGFPTLGASVGRDGGARQQQRDPARALPSLQSPAHRAAHVDVLPQSHLPAAQVPDNQAGEGPGELDGEGLGVPEHGGEVAGEESELVGRAAGSGGVLWRVIGGPALLPGVAERGGEERRPG